MNIVEFVSIVFAILGGSIVVGYGKHVGGYLASLAFPTETVQVIINRFEMGRKHGDDR